jgi:hypothetical protein
MTRQAKPAAGRDVPPLYRGIAAAVPRSRASAVKLFCLECVGYVRADVTTCTAQHCPLYLWRPYQDGSDEDSAPPQNAGANAPETRQTRSMPPRTTGGRFVPSGGS